MAILDIKEAVRLGEAEFLCLMSQKVAKPNGIFFEVGSWKGYSSAFIGTIAKKNNCTLYCVDHWNGSSNVPHQTQSPDCLEIFRKNMAWLGLKDTVFPLVMSSAIAGKIVKDNTADFIFIDADHRYESIKEDLDIWWPKLKVGGIICGHDCEWKYDKSSQSNKDSIEKNLSVDFTYETLPYPCHPGVVKAVYEKFGDKYTVIDDTTLWFVVKQ